MSGFAPLSSLDVELHSSCCPHAHQQFVVGKADAFFPIPDGVSDADAAWFTLSYIVQNGVRRGQHELGEDYVVVGLGPLGQLAVQFLNLLGAREIIAVDPVQFRLDLAKAHGATQGLALNVDEILPHVEKLTHGQWRGCAARPSKWRRMNFGPSRVAISSGNE